MKYWTKIPAKIREQILRAGRLFVAAWLALIAPVLGGTVPVSWGFVCSTFVASAEVVFRGLVPVVPVKAPVVAPAAPNAGQAGVVRNGLLVTVLVVLAIIALIVWLLPHIHIH